MPVAYDQWLGPAVFRPFALDLAARAAGTGRRRVLEVAAGSGLLTRELRRALPDAELIATDLNAAMVEYGSGQVPEATWKQADVLQLPFSDGTFDLVACQFGVMFLPDKVKGYAEMRRVLASSGRVLANTWAMLDKHGFADALCRALERLFPDDPPVFLSKIPHGYADPDLVEVDLRAGGLDLVSMESVTIEGTAASAADIATGFCTGTPLRAEIESRADLSSTVAAVQADLKARFGGGPVTAAMTAYVFEAQPR